MLALLVTFSSSIYFHQHEEKSFLLWMRKTNQFFVGDEYRTRFGIFLTNSRIVTEHNRTNSRYTVSLNKYAAYTPSEYKVLLGLYAIFPQRSTMKKTEWTITSVSCDWRDKGVVSPVNDQGQCSASWAFCAIECIESADAIATGVLQIFSVQNLIDCVTTCNGCNGGLATNAFDYVISNQKGKFCLGSDYEYTASEGVCKFTQYSHVGSISGYVNVEPSDDEEELASMIEQYGPAIAALDASGWAFQLYSGGIFNDKSCSQIYVNHYILIVGFGMENETNYWIVRNSWGNTWGEDGYIRILRGFNICGIASMPIVSIP